MTVKWSVSTKKEPAVRSIRLSHRILDDFKWNFWDGSSPSLRINSTVKRDKGHLSVWHTSEKLVCRLDRRLYSKCNERNRSRARIGSASRISIRGRESWRLGRGRGGSRSPACGAFSSISFIFNHRRDIIPASLSRHAAVVESEGRSLISPERRSSPSPNSDRYSPPVLFLGKGGRERSPAGGKQLRRILQLQNTSFSPSSRPPWPRPLILPLITFVTDPGIS